MASPKPGADSSSEPSRRSGLWAMILACFAVALSICLLLTGFPLVPQSDMWSMAALMLLLMVGLFPLSAIAFARLEAPLLIEQLERDTRLLGAPERMQAAASHSARRWSNSSYAIHYCPAMVATALGLGLFFLDNKLNHRLLDINTLQAMRYGFLGAYVYCLGLVYRRYTTLDLQPHVYLHCAASLIAGIVFNYVAFEAISSLTASTATPVPSVTPPGATPVTSVPSVPKLTGLGETAAAILAFSLGYFPNLAVRWFSRLSRTSLGERQRRSDELPLALVDGISVLHEARLRDEGIDNLQNLATANIRDLVASTPFSAQEVVEWIDQAVLYLYLDPSQIESFRRAGVRSVTDFGDLWRGLYVNYEVQSDGSFLERPKPEPAAVTNGLGSRRKAIAQQLQSTEERLDGLYLATREGPNMDVVRTYWQNVQELTTRARKSIVRQVCSSVGRRLRESAREGDAATTDDVLKQIAESLFQVLAEDGDDDLSAEVTPESIYGEAWLNILSGRITEAQSLFEQCIQEFPESPAAYNDLAWLVLDTLKRPSLYEKAFKYAEKAVELAGKPSATLDLPGYLDTLALAYIRRGKPMDGFEKVKQAILAREESNEGQQPKFLETLVTAAEVLLAQKKKEDATKVLDFVDDEGYADKATRDRADSLRKQL
jgi:tetratricopeptide (TPR) repeat protein